MRKTLNTVVIAAMAAAGGAFLAAMADAARRPGAGGVSRAADARRQARPERDLAGAERSQLRLEMHMARPALALRAGPTGRCRRRRCSRSARSARCRPASASSRAARFPTSRRRSPQKKENQDKWLERDPEIKCYLPGVPRATYMPQPFQILQSHERVLHRLPVRRRGAQHLSEGSGSAAGRFVDGPVGRPLGGRNASSSRSNGFNDSTWFDRAGNFHSDQLKVVERYTRTQPDVISYEATITDPETFTRPWKISMPLYRRAREERAADGLQVRGVRRGAAVRRVPEEAAERSERG